MFFCKTNRLNTALNRPKCSRGLENKIINGILFEVYGKQSQNVGITESRSIP